MVNVSLSAADFARTILPVWHLTVLAGECGVSLNILKRMGLS
jgi:hypothetical protein